MKNKVFRNKKFRFAVRLFTALPFLLFTAYQFFMAVQIETNRLGRLIGLVLYMFLTIASFFVFTHNYLFRITRTILLITALTMLFVIRILNLPALINSFDISHPVSVLNGILYVITQIETLVLLADYMVARSKMKEKKRFKITAFMTVILILMYISCLMIECLLMFRYHTNIDLRLDLALISRILYCFAFIGATVCLMFPGPKKKKKDPKKNNRGTLEKNKDIVELVG